MEDENSCQQFEEIYQSSKSAEDIRFDRVIMQLQEIMIDPNFEKSLTSFMESNWGAFGENGKGEGELKVFEAYQTQMRAYLQNNIRKKIPDFEWHSFGQLFQTRREMVDEQILDTLLSFEDVENFKAFIRDYRKSYEQVEMFKVLTVKSTKVSENKKVKGKDNIFSGGDNNMFDKGLKPVMPKKKEAKEKTEEELMVPDMILTVKPIKKG